jgi:hypothetical protein
MVMNIGISPAELAHTYPRLYHMAEAHTWESVREHGLLSTTALLDLFQKNGRERVSIESEWRPQKITIQHDQYGKAVIRDQIPMRESALAKCLVGMTVTQWYRNLNRRVFFWLTRDRLMTLLCAKAYRDSSHCVLTIDTARLLDRHIKNVTLSPINSGRALYNPRPRGPRTFLPLSKYPFVERKKLRGVANAIAELSADYSVRDIEELVVCVDHMKRGKVLSKLYPP